MPATRRRARAACALVFAMLGCDLSTAPDLENAPDLRGAWTMTGAQTAPSLQLFGTITINAQNGAEISGAASWEERDGAGGVRLEGGAVFGRLLSVEDVDFDVTLDSGERRMVARIIADTLEGVWTQPSISRSGTFRAVREQP